MMNSVARALVDQTLLAGNSVSFTVPTRSMLPFLAPGDQVIVQAVKASELKIGDLIVWKAQATDDTPSAWIVHRLIERRRVNDKSFLITQGDNAPFADKPVTESQLCGVVAIVQRRNSKRVVRMLSPRARWFGVILARISFAQSIIHIRFQGMARRILAKAMRIIGSWVSYLTREMIG